ncbi:rhomboid family intramembrane serine protease [Diaminobutyricimonas sp. TR449]|uniref:rhomboid family intramembrane serine protease n=1 Tax=Diaminobutyricimonas sp. TR449 TaxID=2708076 RepID=UPI001421BB7D|nr:rhomboid family intramembrane serine protease [Diaminobutyricimonas sp. TR449]
MSHVTPGDPNATRDEPEFDRDEVIDPEPEPTVPTEPEPTVPIEPEPTPPIEPEPTPPTGPEPTPPVAPEPERPIDPIEIEGPRKTPELVEPPAAERAEYSAPVLPDLESVHADDVARLREPVGVSASSTSGIGSTGEGSISEAPAGGATAAAASAGVATAPATGVSTSSTSEEDSTHGVEERSASDRPQIVYISEPIPPKNRSNRGVGTLLAVASAVVFLVLYAAVAGLIIAMNIRGNEFFTLYASFIADPTFWVPVIVFTVAYILLVLIVNRAGWWAHVLGGFIVAVLTYLAFIGGALLGIEAWNFTLEEVTGFTDQLWYSPFAIAAFIIAREVPIWIGAAISARGRQVKTRNAEAREEFDREQARVRSEYERSYSTAP